MLSTQARAGTSFGRPVRLDGHSRGAARGTTHCRPATRVSKLAAMSTPVVTPRVARIFFGVAVAGMALMVLAVALFLAGLFSRQPAFSLAAEIALIACMFCQATVPGFRAYLLFRSGRWTSLSGKLTSREEQPRRFAVLLSFSALLAAIWAATGGYIFWYFIVSRF